MGGKRKIDETPQQRALAEFAMNQLRDYKQRWLPVQKQLAAQIQQQGAEGSFARQAAAGKNDTDVAMSFDRGTGVLTKTLANNGVGVGSSRGKLALAGMGTDQAKTGGIGAMISEQQMDDAYLKGLSALTSIGRGEHAAVADGLVDRARSSAKDAQLSAEASATERGQLAGFAGQAAGLGLYGALGQSSPGYSLNTTDFAGTNNTAVRLRRL
jgi:hypothetical protein